MMMMINSNKLSVWVFNSVMLCIFFSSESFASPFATCIHYASSQSALNWFPLLAKEHTPWALRSSSTGSQERISTG